MRHSLIALAVLGTLASSQVVMAAEEAPTWTVTNNIGFVSNYYFRGISQSWNKPAVQGGIDIAHSSGFYVGAWGSNVTPNTYPDATLEVDAYAGYNGTISAVEGLGYTVGLYGYFYPGGSWKKYTFTGTTPAGAPQTPDGGEWNTYEANFGVSYNWLSAKASVTLGDWFGAEKSTGWKDSTSGSTYLELNAAYPLPMVEGLTLVGHVGRLDVSSELNTAYTSSNGQQPSLTNFSISPDYTDWKIGLSKAFAIGKAEGFNAGLYWVDASNNSYWSNRGYGGSSFNGSAETRNLNSGRLVFSLSRTF